MDWLPEFLDWHRGRFDPFDWPASDSDEYVEYILDWQEAFGREGVSQDEARRASRRLSLAPPKYRREHIPALMQVVATMRAERGAPAAAPESRDAATAASRGCKHCDGGGLVTLWHPNPDPARRTPPTCAGHCVCPLGRFMRSKVGQGQDGDLMLRRIPDLAVVLNGRSGWLLHPPGSKPMDDPPDDDDGPDGEPGEPPWRGPSRTEVNAMFSRAEP